MGKAICSGQGGQHRLPPGMMTKLRLKKGSSLLDTREGKAFQAEETVSAKVLGQEGAGAREELQHGLSRVPGEVSLAK